MLGERRPGPNLGGRSGMSQDELGSEQTSID
jgi:hypothetical protein